MTFDIILLLNGFCPPIFVINLVSAPRVTDALLPIYFTCSLKFSLSSIITHRHLIAFFDPILVSPTVTFILFTIFWPYIITAFVLCAARHVISLLCVGALVDALYFTVFQAHRGLCHHDETYVSLEYKLLSNYRSAAREMVLTDIFQNKIITVSNKIFLDFVMKLFPEKQKYTMICI